MLKKICSCVLVFALMLTCLASGAEAGSVFTARRTFGVLFLSSSVLMAKKAVDFKRDADDIYEAYKLARNAQDANNLFDRASDRDTKSQMSVGLSAILLVSGLRLLIHSGIDNNIPKIDRRIKIDLSSDVHQKKVGLALKRMF
ncbi:MAG: hypothetical protein ACI8V2_000062 [Candidatus Latescibacterota bacterium]|jgi:hypothetical protein